MRESDGSIWRVKGDSISLERLDGETIVINFDSGEYFSFRGSSADILWLVDAGVDRSHWSQILEEAFVDLTFDDVVGDVDDFLEQLSQAGLIEHVPGTGGDPVALPDDYERHEWTQPVVAGNDDLADLLVIDPIHDTGEDGWPQTRSNQ